jgi:GNAT superfamily N-acetyltransferase
MSIHGENIFAQKYTYLQKTAEIPIDKREKYRYNKTKQQRRQLNMKIELYRVGSGETEASQALRNTISQEDTYMHYRLNGNALQDCDDYYFVAHENGVALSRLWMCFPRHAHAIGNWGAFFTLEECRGQGIGSQVLDFCFRTIPALPNLPLGLFCTSGKTWVTNAYRKRGFTLAIPNTENGPMYFPIGQSPKNFQDFCAQYFTPTTALIAQKATWEWRNEVDCLLKFAMIDRGMSYAINGEIDLHMILLNTPERDAKVILTAEQKCAGWMLDGKAVVHPMYEHLLPSLCVKL